MSEFPPKLHLKTDNGHDVEVVTDYNILTKKVDLHATCKRDQNTWSTCREEYNEDDPQAIIDLYMKIALLRIDLHIEANR